MSVEFNYIGSHARRPWCPTSNLANAEA